MKKILVALLLTFFPLLAMATSSLSLTPPPGDYSVMYLSNMFGIVDGVLHGTGSQIMGAMFAVFNAAVLALGGIVIMYTVLVGTMNTAHDGEAMGKNWSSIWIPLRSTIGLSLLMPKASGYCLMQIFVMWVVVQGVGAADLVWNAALGYLNRGGVILQQQMNPITSLTANGDEVATGALAILTGQVCMLGLQSILITARQKALNTQQTSGPCYQNPKATIQYGTSVTSQFCANAVPDFLGSVNAVTAQQTPETAPTPAAPSGDVVMQMPYFDSTIVPYNSLNGICGTITWLPFPVTTTMTQIAGSSLVASSDPTALSRAIAIQQMYSDLSVVAQSMVSNSPDLGTGTSTGCTGVASGYPAPTPTCFSAFAINQFGVGYTSSGFVCSNIGNCTTWGSDPTESTAPLFNGTEFQGAIADYNGIMMPTLNLQQESGNTSAALNSRAFINNAVSQGWMLAGAYFFDLVRLNGSATGTGSNSTDSGTDLNNSVQYMTALSSLNTGFGNDNVCLTGNAATSVLCQLMASSVTYTNSNGVQTPTAWSYISTSSSDLVLAIQGLITGTGYSAPAPLSVPSFQNGTAINGVLSSTVYAYVTNATILALPGQNASVVPTFKSGMNINFAPGMFYLTAKHFSCGKMGALGCVGRALGNIFWNDMLRYILNFFLDTIFQLVNTLILMMLQLPLLAIQSVLLYMVIQIQEPGVNPILALSNMGTTTINTSMELWMYIYAGSEMTGPLMLPFFMMMMPLLASWMGVMVAIGFITAFYVPFIPYMTFSFGALAWFMSVVEAIAAAPLIALGVANPEGHETLGKGENAVMILMGVFLRPALMIIGYIAAIGLCYISVWMINAGYSHAVSFIQSPAGMSSSYADNCTTTDTSKQNGQALNSNQSNCMTQSQAAGGQAGYSNWAGMYSLFFGILIYTMLYVTVVQNAFNLIYLLPDKVLRWIGGSAENIGEQAAGMRDETKGKVTEGGKGTAEAGQSQTGQMSAIATQGLKGDSGGSGSAGASGQDKS